MFAIMALPQRRLADLTVQARAIIDRQAQLMIFSQSVIQPAQAVVTIANVPFE
jgi:hypothetical protein